MTRASLYLRRVLFALSLWLILVIFRQNFPQKFNLIILLLPLIAIFFFGLYAATNILFHLVTFKECPNAFIELQKEISEAKLDLKRKGIKII